MIDFIHIPKAAGSSICEIIKDSEQFNYVGHERFTEALNPTFSITRNPYDRLISAYNYLKKGGGLNELDLGYKEVLRKYPTFKDFVKHIEADNLIEKIVHIKPMTYFVCEEGEIMVDHLFQLENLTKIDLFLQSFGLQKLSEVKERVVNLSQKREKLDRNTIRIINRVYEEDFKIFNYKMI